MVSYTANEIREKLEKDSNLKVWFLDTGEFDDDDILLGEREEIICDIKNHFLQLGELADCYIDLDTNPDTGLPKGWTLEQIPSEEIEEYLT